jgi:hypothetical protein
MAKALGIGGEYDRVPRDLPVRRSGSNARLSAQCSRAEDLVSRNGRIQLGAGIRSTCRTELVVGQSVHHRGDTSPDAAGQLQSGQSGQGACLHESARCRFQDGKLASDRGFGRYRSCISGRHAAALAQDAALRRGGTRYTLLSHDGGIASGPAVLFHMAVFPDHRSSAPGRLRSAWSCAQGELGCARGRRPSALPVASGIPARSAGLRKQPRCHCLDCGRTGMAPAASVA